VNCHPREIQNPLPLLRGGKDQASVPMNMTPREVTSISFQMACQKKGCNLLNFKIIYLNANRVPTVHYENILKTY
jgi:hypothetical protein